MAAAAEQLLAATGWLPPLLRTAAPQGQAGAPRRGAKATNSMRASSGVRVSAGRKDGPGAHSNLARAPHGARPVQLR